MAAAIGANWYRRGHLHRMGIAGHLFLQLAIILLAGRGAGVVLRRVQQPQVVAEMVVGLLLGPSLFGLLAPRLQSALFPGPQGAAAGAAVADHPSMAVLFAIGQLGLVLYMFLVGAQLDLASLGRHRGDAGRISVVGIAVPGVAGAVLGIILVHSERLFPATVSTGEAALFLASALSVTAFPVLARILTDSGAARSRVGTLALSAAAFDDGIAWGLLALTLALSEGTALRAVGTVVGSIVFVAVMVIVVRPLLKRVAWSNERFLGPMQLTLLLALVLGSAAVTEWIGVHAILGAFLAGAILPRGPMANLLRQAIEPVTLILLLPVFFVSAGLKTDIDSLDDLWSFGVMALIILVAFVSKGGGCVLAMRMGGASWRQAGAVGALMNARGLMELTFITIALERGLITTSLYTMLALLAIVTTMAAPPLFSWLHRPEAEDLPLAATDSAVATSGS
jgi:Kef-type K+ transport system membrane component KefB